MSAVICDIDGTLLRNGSIPISHTIEFLQSLSDRYDIIVVTARPENSRKSTAAALRKAGVPYDSLKMNNIGRTHAEGLQSKLANAKSITGQQKVVYAIDNDADARAVYAQLNIKTLNPAHLPDQAKK
jgi:ribonucleotide monophosphatase NagD (HAD superfamily)